MQVNYWVEREKWPYVPPTHLFFPDFFEQVGQAIFSDDWTGYETRDPDVQPELPSPTKIFEGDSDLVADPSLYRRHHMRARELIGCSLDKAVNSALTQQEWTEARDRWYEIDIRAPKNRMRRAVIRRIIHDGAAAGTLSFRIREPESGEFSDFGQAIWNCAREVVYPRFITCSLSQNRSDCMRSPPSDRSEREEYYLGFNQPLYIARKNARWALPHLVAWYRNEIDELPHSNDAAEPTQLVLVTPAPDNVPKNNHGENSEDLPLASLDAIEAFAAMLDAKKIPKRKVDTNLLKKHWDMADGAVPKLERVHKQMQGQPKGRRKEAKG